VRFAETDLAGVVLVDLEPHEDERGFFARAFCADEFAAHGLSGQVAQANTSFNHRRGTVRGLHWQAEGAEEAKFFRCIRGATWHVVVDVRPESPTRLRHSGVELSAESRRGLYVPPLCATGYQTLTDGAEVLYLVSARYSPAHERGLRYDDPALGIEWPLPVSVVSEKDRGWPLLAAAGKETA
jgi:dTDP-4-dehydrorhamnose 3,5-epimerase